ncbi:MAG: cyclic nucleotide-binding domain-containing protein [Desulfatibacillaceae bacterium]
MIKDDAQVPIGGMRKVIMEGLASMPIFKDLSEEELKVVASHMLLFEVGEGEVLFEEGAKGYYMCFVASGELEVSKASDKGEQVVITTLTRGNSIGEMAIVDDFPRSATVVARTDSELAALKRSDFHNLLDAHPYIGIKVLKAVARLLSRNLRNTSSELVKLMLPVM